jgi:hypothetical protein
VPEFFIRTDCAAVVLTNGIKRSIGQFIKPSTPCKYEAAYRTSRPLNEDNVSFAYRLEGSAPNSAKAGFNRLAAVEDEAEERLNADGEMQSD